MYVAALRPEDNAVVLGEGESLFSRDVRTETFHWIPGKPPRGPVRCRAKIRYRHPEAPATAYPQPDGSVHIEFDEPQRAVTPGQTAVLYDGDEVLGGGTIIRE
jgi:tRNA-specific 2-thiouridylase